MGWIELGTKRHPLNPVLLHLNGNGTQVVHHDYENWSFSVSGWRGGSDFMPVDSLPSLEATDQYEMDSLYQRHHLMAAQLCLVNSPGAGGSHLGECIFGHIETVGKP